MCIHSSIGKCQCELAYFTFISTSVPFSLESINWVVARFFFVFKHKKLCVKNPKTRQETNWWWWCRSGIVPGAINLENVCIDDALFWFFKCRVTIVFGLPFERKIEIEGQTKQCANWDATSYTTLVIGTHHCIVVDVVNSILSCVHMSSSSFANNVLHRLDRVVYKHQHHRQ